MAKFFYSPLNDAFYVDEINYSIPEDAFEITEEQHYELMEGQSSGKQIAYVGRKLTLVDPTKPNLSWADIRKMRGKLLSKSDWALLPDNQLNDTARQSWIEYRQQLRDITETFDNPNDVIWPSKPVK